LTLGRLRARRVPQVVLLLQVKPHAGLGSESVGKAQKNGEAENGKGG
jgi:hypothetical protein